MIRTFATIAAVSAAALLSFAALPSSAPASVGPLAVVHMHEQLFAAIDAGDADAAREFLQGDMHMDDKWRRRPCTLALTGVDGLSGLAVGRQASCGLMDEWTDTARPGTKTRITNWVSDCHSGDLSYATLEFERTYRSSGEQVTNRYVSTSLVTYVNGGWRITHMQIASAPERHPGSLTLQAPGMSKKGLSKKGPESDR